MKLVDNPIAPQSTYLSLIIANLMPLYGVLFLGWEVIEVVIFYWLETFIIGLINAIKIALCQGKPPRDEQEQVERLGGIFPFLMRQKQPQEQEGEIESKSDYKDVNEMSKAFVIPFFLFHYNAFVLVQFMFVCGLVDNNRFDPFSPIDSFMEMAQSTPYFLPSLLLIIGSHLHSLVVNYIQGEEYLEMDKGSQMLQPYGRIFIQQFVVIIGAWLVMLLNAPVFLVVILVLLKIAADLIAHRESHLALQ